MVSTGSVESDVSPSFEPSQIRRRTANSANNVKREVYLTDDSGTWIEEARTKARAVPSSASPVANIVSLTFSISKDESGIQSRMNIPASSGVDSPRK
jgi:hypothetical protein